MIRATGLIPIFEDERNSELESRDNSTVVS